VTFVTPIVTGGVCYFLTRRSLKRAATDRPKEVAKTDMNAPTDLTHTN
jgi:hypothetical protein